MKSLFITLALVVALTAGLAVAETVVGQNDETDPKPTIVFVAPSVVPVTAGPSDEEFHEPARIPPAKIVRAREPQDPVGREPEMDIEEVPVEIPTELVRPIPDPDDAKVRHLRGLAAKLKNLDREDPDFRKTTTALYAAINALIDSDRLNGELEEMVRDDSNPVAQRIGIWGFGNLAYRGKKLMPASDIVHRMMDLSRDDRAPHRAVVAEAFDRMRDPRFRGVLDQLAKDRDSKVSWMARRGVGNLEALGDPDPSRLNELFPAEASPHPHWNPRSK